VRWHCFVCTGGVADYDGWGGIFRYRLRCPLVVFWGESAQDVWYWLTDLSARAACSSWCGYCAWIEWGFRSRWAWVFWGVLVSWRFGGGCKWEVVRKFANEQRREVGIPGAVGVGRVRGRGEKSTDAPAGGAGRIDAPLRRSAPASHAARPAPRFASRALQEEVQACKVQPTLV